MSVLNKPEDVPAGFQSAWNAHDMNALADLFTEDATFVNRFGHFVRGVTEIVAMHRPIHETVYRDSTMANEILDVSYLAKDIAVIHSWSRLTAGVAHPAGAHQVDTVILAVVVHRVDGWKICALENVTVTDPRTGEVRLRDT
jgi:uncharacterized protein (TIGR02246 family)